MDIRSEQSSNIHSVSMFRFFVQSFYGRGRVAGRTSFSQRLFSLEPIRIRRTKMIALAFFWGAGLVAGIMIAADGKDCTYLEHSFVLQQENCLLLFFSLYLALSAGAVISRIPGGILSLCFWKSFLFSFSSGILLIAHGPQGWPIRWLLCFSQLTSIPILYFFWIRHYCDAMPVSKRELVMLFALLLFFDQQNRFHVFPFFQSVIYHLERKAGT